MVAQKILRRQGIGALAGTDVEYLKFTDAQREIDNRVAAQLVRYRTKAITVTVVRKTNHDHHPA